MPAAPDRRLVILAEGNFGFHHGKTAMGVIVQETTLNAVAYGSMVRSSNKDSLDEEETESKSVQQDSGERRGLIPMPKWFRRD